MRWGLYKWAKWIKASHSTAMCADQKKKKRDKGKNKGKNKSMSWIIQWLGCTPKVSALWPLWQEVKGSAAAAGINGADMFRSGPESEWQRKLTRDVKLYEHTLKLKIHIWVEYTLITHSLSVCLNSACIHLLQPLRVKGDLWTPTHRTSPLLSSFNNMCRLITKSMCEPQQCI